MLIGSTQNPKIKFIRQLKKRKYRDEHKLFLIEGKREIERALKCGLKIHSYYYSNQNTNKLVLTTDKHEINGPLFQKISYRKNSTGHLAIFHQPSTDINDIQLKPQPFILVIESPEKPGNIGALLRTADAVGVDSVIITNPDTDLFNPNAIRSACGTFFSRPIYLSDNQTTLDILQKNKIKTVATTPDTKNLYHQADYPSSIALIAGAENQGLSDFWLNHADLKIKIPMQGIADSLNLSVSTAIILYKIREQRHQP